MGRSKRGGRPKGSTYALTMMYFQVARHMQIKLPKTKQGETKSKLTAWNAWKKFTESKQFPPLVKLFYKRYKNSGYYIRRMLDPTNAAWRNKFYTNNIKRRGKDNLINYLFTKPHQFTRRKKR